MKATEFEGFLEAERLKLHEFVAQGLKEQQQNMKVGWNLNHTETKYYATSLVICFKESLENLFEEKKLKLEEDIKAEITVRVYRLT